MRKLVLRWVINGAAVYAAIWVVPGIRAEGGLITYFAMALILGLVNAIIAPVIKLLTCPLILLTLGLFTLVINGAMLLLASSIGSSLRLAFEVDGFPAAFLGALVISVVSFVLSVLTGINREDRRKDRKK
ncbi:MAG: phage holin family protein [Anaerolineales bacterium]|jgi:putative membrane protein|nr:MAG: phage holin family protein [Anaerolineales bacterium]